MSDRGYGAGGAKRTEGTTELNVNRMLWRGLAGAGLLCLGTAPALAHHAMEGAMPAGFGQGLLSGLAHPVIGIDHLAFVVAAGLLSARHSAWFLLPAAFVLGGLAGAWLHLGGMDMPGAEIGIALSVLLLGIAVMTATRLSGPLVGVLFAAAGLVHGYALAESIIGAEPTPLAAYLIGLTVTQYGVSLGAGWLTRRLAGAATGFGRTAPRAVGALVALTGLAFLSSGLLA